MKKILSILFLTFLCLSIFADINNELIMAVKNGDVEKVQRLIEQSANVNAKRENGWTALRWAAFFGHKEIVKLLIQAGADVNAKEYEYGRTALYYAREEGHEEIVQLLLEAGAVNQ